MTAGKVRTRKDGSLTHDHFFLRELRIVARLRQEGKSDQEIVSLAESQNIFQYPTTNEAGRIARTVLMRLDALEDPAIMALVATGDAQSAAQANLYAMMRVYPLMAAFMTEEIAPRYRGLDYYLSRADVHGFLTRYQARLSAGEPWSESTVTRISHVLREALAGAGLLADSKSEDLLPLFLDPDVEDVIRRNGHSQWLSAFNVAEVM